MDIKDQKIILFDGVCNLCNGIVQYIIKRDPQGKFLFASLQSEKGQSLLQHFNNEGKNIDSFVFLNKGTFYIKSTAGLHVMKELGGVWGVMFGLVVLPKPFRDFFYDIIARNRYNMFGKQHSCMMPTPEIKKRFLD